MHPSHGIVPKESGTGSGLFANAHDFVIQQAVLNDNMTINTQNLIYNQPTYDEPLSPLRSTAARTSQYFVGQEKYLGKLHEYFRPGNTSERKMFLLYGMGGIGKTQICMKFNDEMDGQYAYTFWIDATSEDTIVQSLKEIYKMTSTSGTYASSFSSAVVLKWISNVKSEWLMIFDNADGSPELIEKFLPPGNVGNIVITSRNPALKRITTHKNSLEVSEMSEEWPLTFFSKQVELTRIQNNTWKNQKL
ncbi:P-loop containing nucleoside triphosphate hydrolase protein [Cyathus striatus]|nr:P-loop containing nucleoside triphosphate hydrolase protein [Cyathus striatus]